MSSAHVAQLEATGYTLVDPEGAKKGWWRNQDAFARDKMLGSKPPVPEARKKERPVAEERSIQGRKLFGGKKKTLKRRRRSTRRRIRGPRSSS
jgi:hypothetical protein